MITASAAAEVQVWDLFVRVGHWLLLAATVTACLTERAPRASAARGHADTG